MITTNNGTLIVFAQARVHSTDATPSSVVMRRSFDDGETWEPTRVVLPDYFNATEQVGESLYDPATDTIFFFENHVDFRIRHPGCSTCALWQMSSTDHGLTWTNQTVINLADPKANQTEPWGGGNRCRESRYRPLSSDQNNVHVCYCLAQDIWWWTGFGDCTKGRPVQRATSCSTATRLRLQ